MKKKTVTVKHFRRVVRRLEKKNLTFSVAYGRGVSDLARVITIKCDGKVWLHCSLSYFVDAPPGTTFLPPNNLGITLEVHPAGVI